jgi:hypothetical protein
MQRDSITKMEANDGGDEASRRLLSLTLNEIDMFGDLTFLLEDQFDPGREYEIHHAAGSYRVLVSARASAWIRGGMCCSEPVISSGRCWNT